MRVTFARTLDSGELFDHNPAFAGPVPPYGPVVGELLSPTWWRRAP
jgi:hypothetical protein